VPAILRTRTLLKESRLSCFNLRRESLGRSSPSRFTGPTQYTGVEFTLFPSSVVSTLTSHRPPYRQSGRTEVKYSRWSFTDCVSVSGSPPVRSRDTVYREGVFSSLPGNPVAVAPSILANRGNATHGPLRAMHHVLTAIFAHRHSPLKRRVPIDRQLICNHAIARAPIHCEVSPRIHSRFFPSTEIHSGAVLYCIGYHWQINKSLSLLSKLSCVIFCLRTFL